MSAVEAGAARAGATQPFVLGRKPATAGRTPPLSGRTREEIIACVRRWAELYGSPPITTDWEPARARARGEHWRIERFERGDWPTLRMVRARFGRFNAAIEAAGFEANRAPKRIRRHLSDDDQVLAAIHEWTRRYGDVPTQADWDPVRARKLGQHWRIARYEAGDWPSMRTATYHFGSFGKAIRAAGLSPREGTEGVAARVGRRDANRRRLVEHAATTPGTSGPAGLAKAVRMVARARAAGDAEGLHAALLDTAAMALRWAGCLDLDGDRSTPSKTRERRAVSPA